MHEELSGEESTFRKHRIAGNAIFHTHQSDGYTVEEIKMVNETRKILRLHDLKIAVTCVRLPFEASHGESVNIEFEKPFRISEIRQLFKDSEGIVLIDDMAHEEYPTPLLAAGTDPVYVGRIRRDYSVENGLMLWVVADNVRKGAATNAVQIAEKLVSMDLMGYDKNIFVFKALLK